MKPWIFLSTGQSNSEGQGVGGPDATGDVETYYSGNGEFHKGYNSPPWNMQGNVGSKIALGFGQRLFDLTGRPVRIIPRAQGGQPISQWMGQGAPLYSSLKNQILPALAKLGVDPIGAIDGVIWHQGEADALNPNYADDLDGVIAQFFGESWLADDALFGVGELARGGTTAAGTKTDAKSIELRALEGGIGQRTFYAQAHNLNTTDGLHYDAHSLWVLGSRYADAFVARRALRSGLVSPVSGTTKVLAPGEAVVARFPFTSLNIDYKPMIDFQISKVGNGDHRVQYSSRTDYGFAITNKSPSAEMTVRWFVPDAVDPEKIGDS